MPKHNIFAERGSTFDLPEPVNLVNPEMLWATWYWCPTLRAYRGRGAVRLLGWEDNYLGHSLKNEDFCRGAVEGSFRVQSNNSFQLYNLRGFKTDQPPVARCDAPESPRASYARFYKSASPYGEGSTGYYLVPFRSIAVDTRKFPIDTLLYFPDSRGNPISLPDGRQVTHDGYFFAADIGETIEDNHIDVFLGVTNQNPFSWVTSDENGQFRAYKIENPAIVARLKAEHQP